MKEDRSAGNKDYGKKSSRGGVSDKQVGMQEPHSHSLGKQAGSLTAWKTSRKPNSHILKGRQKA